jgi:phospholipid/cholesterol/gamma-HCH transport system substrate-binding protein
MAIVDDVGKSVASLQGIVGGLNSEMPKISAMLNETRTAIQQAQDVLEGVKNNPLIRGGVPERAVQESLYGSMREGSFE